MKGKKTALVFVGILLGVLLLEGAVPPVLVDTGRSSSPGRFYQDNRCPSLWRTTKLTGLGWVSTRLSP